MRACLVCLCMVPLYAYARWSMSRLSGKGVDVACDGGVYPCVPIGFGCGVPRGWDKRVLRVLFRMISFVFLMYMPCRARSFRLVWMKFVCCVSGDPSWRRASRNRWTWLLLVR